MVDGLAVEILGDGDGLVHAAQVLPDFQKNASQEAAMSQQFDRPTHLPASREAQTLYNQLQAPNFTADQEIYPASR